MSDHVYKLVELVGSSKQSVSDAINNALGRAGSSLRNVKWFEVIEIRGGVTDGKAVEKPEITQRQRAQSVDPKGRGAAGHHRLRLRLARDHRRDDGFEPRQLQTARQRKEKFRRRG